MKFFYLLALSLTLIACSESEKPAGKIEKKAEQAKIELKPQTINLGEVSRIALVQAKQFIDTIKQKAPKADISSVQELYDKAQKLYDNKEYKEAQKVAVEVRQLAENMLLKARMGEL